MIVEPDGAPCRCGRRGCLEAYVNDGAIAGRACLLMGKPSPRDDAAINDMVKAATNLALAGDNQLRWIFATAGTRLGRAVANMANVLAPRRVIVTGEAMRAEDLLMRPFTDAFSETLLPVLAARTELVWHKTGDEIWAQGAAARVLSHRFAGKS
jgi:predicted NBD/HSP70 family sugar kinase